jgi:hypothetical protein
MADPAAVMLGVPLLTAAAPALAFCLLAETAGLIE